MHEEAGAYARKQILCADPVIRWSHQARFRLARHLVAVCEPQSLLDYGCGDGTFLASLPRSVRLLGADVDLQQLDSCRTRRPDLRFQAIDEVRASAERFDVITCMEVLEHCPTAERRAVLSDLQTMLAPQGRVVISVPIEIGLTLLLKQLLRRLAGWRRLGDYQYTDRYTWPELARMLFAGPDNRVLRPSYREVHAGREMSFHPHKGFNWKALRRELEQDFRIEATRCSPLPWLGGTLNSQVWFVCRHR